MPHCIMYMLQSSTPGDSVCLSHSGLHYNTEARICLILLYSMLMDIISQLSLELSYDGFASPSSFSPQALIRGC